MAAADGTEGAEKFYIQCSCIVEQAANDALYLLEECFIKWWDGVDFIWFVLRFCAVGNGTLFMGQMLQFVRVWMSKQDLDIIDVAIHCQTTGAFAVNPIQINTCKFISTPFRSHLLGFLEGRDQVFGMLVTSVLHVEVIVNQDKQYCLRKQK